MKGIFWCKILWKLFDCWTEVSSSNLINAKGCQWLMEKLQIKRNVLMWQSRHYDSATNISKFREWSSLWIITAQLINIHLIVAPLADIMMKQIANQTKSVKPIIIHNKDGWLTDHWLISHFRQQHPGTLDSASI